MNLLSELMPIVSSVFPCETGIFREHTYNEYAVLVPLSDTFGYHADNSPEYDVQSVLIALYSKSNYTIPKNRLIRRLLDADITITARRYIGFEADTGYHHYVLEVEKLYELED